MKCKVLGALAVLFLAGAAWAQMDSIIRIGPGGGGQCDSKMYCEGPGGGNGGGADAKSCYAQGKVYLFNVEGGVWVCVSRATLSTPATHRDANGVYPLLGEKRKYIQEQPKELTTAQLR